MDVSVIYFNDLTNDRLHCETSVLMNSNVTDILFLKNL